MDLIESSVLKKIRSLSVIISDSILSPILHISICCPSFNLSNLIFLSVEEITMKLLMTAGVPTTFPSVLEDHNSFPELMSKA